MAAPRPRLNQAAAVLDASAYVALLRDEPGADRVRSRLGAAAISTVNWVEASQRALEFGGSPRALRRLATEAGIAIVPFQVEHAELAAKLRAPTRRLGLSLADRACLALAGTLELPALTTDRDWARLEVGVEVELIR